MTQVFDTQGKEYKIGSRVRYYGGDWENPADTGTVTRIDAADTIWAVWDSDGLEQSFSSLTEKFKVIVSPAAEIEVILHVDSEYNVKTSYPIHMIKEATELFMQYVADCKNASMTHIR